MPNETPIPGFAQTRQDQARMNEEDLFDQASEYSRALLARAEHYFAKSMPRVVIRFDLRGRSAGMVRFGNGPETVIRYNALLLAQNGQHFLRSTVPHEVAHIVSHTLHGRSIRPHGPEWLEVMSFFGVEGKRCHNYDVSRARARRLKRFNYRCSCREHHLTSIRHNRVAAGQVYLCRHCGSRLEATG